MASMAERVATLEANTACIPAMQTDIDNLKSDRDYRRGQLATLKALAAIAAATGIWQIVGPYVQQLVRHP